MAMIRISGLGATLIAGSALVLGFMGCDSGGSTLTPTSTATGTNTNTSTGTGGKPATGTSATGGKPATGTATGGAGTAPTCTGSTVPTQTVTGGNLNITGGYVTVGSTLKGYGFTWLANAAAATCITPTCGASCTPAITTTLCAAGVVAADSTFATVAGVGFNFNQSSAGGTGSELNVAAPSSVTVVAQLGTGLGDQNARIQIASGVGTSQVSYCVKENTWSSGTPIPISSFNTHCWNTAETGALALAAGTQITSIDITIPSEGTVARPFSVCLAGVTFN